MNSTQFKLSVDGMHCAQCALGVEKALAALGAENVSVNFVTSKAAFTLNDASLLNRCIQRIQSLGYRVHTDGADSHGHSHHSDGFSVFSKFIFSLFFTVPLLVAHLLPFESLHFLHSIPVQLLLGTPVFLLGFIHFGRSGLSSLRSGLPNMDVLIWTGISAAYFYSLLGIILGLGPDYLFFESAASITSLVLMGNLLEERAVRRTTSAIGELSKLQPQFAYRIQTTNSQETSEKISIDSIQVGDLLRVNTGDKIPVDGSIVEGQASVDESMISGEGLPIDKGPGALVAAGTIVVKGSFILKAEAVGAETSLAKIIQLVSEAQTKKPKIQRIGDKIGGIFVHVVIAIALLTFFASWFLFDVAVRDSLMRAIAVLVIACPCAIGLATPAAVMVGIGRAARKGILIKGGDTLEKFAEVKAAILDKTGTLTTGNFKIAQLTPTIPDVELLRGVIVALEQHSSHPIAKSLLQELKSSTPAALSEISEEKGVGMRGKDGSGAVWQLGSKALARARNLEDSHDLYLLKDDALAGTIDIEDEVKAEAPEAIAALNKLGIHVIMLSGDSKLKCEKVASTLGINEVYSEQLPAQKLRIVSDIETQRQTAFVGDGINDAPALARASVGVSLSNATQVAIESAQIVLLNGNLDRLEPAVRISRRTLRIIKENFAWAFSYNLIAIPLAMTGGLNPTWAAFTMAFSDVVVILNSLRLMRE